MTSHERRRTQTLTHPSRRDEDHDGWEAIRSQLARLDEVLDRYLADPGRDE